MPRGLWAARPAISTVVGSGDYQGSIVEAVWEFQQSEKEHAFSRDLWLTRHYQHPTNQLTLTVFVHGDSGRSLRVSRLGRDPSLR